MDKVIGPLTCDWLTCASVAEVSKRRHLEAGYYLAKLDQWRSLAAMNLMLVHGHHCDHRAVDLPRIIHFLSKIPARRFGFAYHSGDHRHHRSAPAPPTKSVGAAAGKEGAKRIAQSVTDADDPMLPDNQTEYVHPRA
jgi:hypothetical protein